MSKYVGILRVGKCYVSFFVFENVFSSTCTNMSFPLLCKFPPVIRAFIENIVFCVEVPGVRGPIPRPPGPQLAGLPHSPLPQGDTRVYRKHFNYMCIFLKGMPSKTHGLYYIYADIGYSPAVK